MTTRSALHSAARFHHALEEGAAEAGCEVQIAELDDRQTFERLWQPRMIQDPLPAEELERLVAW